MQNKIWGNSYRDWADIQEEKSKDGYHFVLDSLSLKDCVRLLDVGCGTGVFSKLASDMGAIVTGIDASTVFIEEAGIRLPTASFLFGDMEDLPFEDGSFDIVCGFNSFQYAASIENALIEAKRVLGRNGKLVIMVWGKKEDCECTALLKAVGAHLPPVPTGHYGPFALSENQLLEQTLSKIGFHKIKTTDISSTWDYADTETALKGLMSLGAVSKAIENVGIEKVKDTIWNVIQPHLQDNGHVIFYNKYRIVMAEK